MEGTLYRMVITQYRIHSEFAYAVHILRKNLIEVTCRISLQEASTVHCDLWPQRL